MSGGVWCVPEKAKKYHFIPMILAITNRSEDTGLGQGCGEMGILISASRMDINRYKHFGKYVGISK